MLSAKACVGKAQLGTAAGPIIPSCHPAFLPSSGGTGFTCGLRGLHAGPWVSGECPGAPTQGVRSLSTRSTPQWGCSWSPALRPPPIFWFLWLLLTSRCPALVQCLAFPLVSLTCPCLRGPEAPPQHIRLGLVSLDTLGLTEDPESEQLWTSPAGAQVFSRPTQSALLPPRLLGR